MRRKIVLASFGSPERTRRFDYSFSQLHFYYEDELEDAEIEIVYFPQQWKDVFVFVVDMPDMIMEVMDKAAAVLSGYRGIHHLRCLVWGLISDRTGMAEELAPWLGLFFEAIRYSTHGWIIAWIYALSLCHVPNSLIRIVPEIPNFGPQMGNNLDARLKLWLNTENVKTPFNLTVDITPADNAIKPVHSSQLVRHTHNYQIPGPFS